MVRTGRALIAAKKPDEAIVWFDKVLSREDLPPNVKQIVESDKARAKQLKAGK